MGADTSREPALRADPGPIEKRGIRRGQADRSGAQFRRREKRSPWTRDPVPDLARHAGLVLLSKKNSVVYVPAWIRWRVPTM